MTTKFYLDTRSLKNKDGIAPVKIAINANGSTVYINTGIRIATNEWDKDTGKIIINPLK